MSINYDKRCRQCDNGIIQKGGEESICDVCDGWGYLLTFEGFALVEFLKRRGFAQSMSPQEEDGLASMLGE